MKQFPGNMPFTKEAPQSPYTLNYIAAYYRSYAIFGAIIALGLDMLSDEFGNGGAFSGVDYDSLPGVPNDFVILIAGGAFLSIGIALCVWNAVTTSRELLGFHARSAGPRIPLLVRLIVISALVLGLLIPYGFAMIGLRILWPGIPA